APKGRRSLMDVEARLLAMGRAALAGYARQALGSETAELADWHARRLAYSEVNPVSGGLYRLAGTARDGGTSVPWSLVLKVVRAPARGLARPAGLAERGARGYQALRHLALLGERARGVASRARARRRAPQARGARGPSLRRRHLRQAR